MVKPVGSGVKAMLMETKDEYYQEDQAAKQARNDAIEDAYSPHKKASRDKNLYDESNY